MNNVKTRVKQSVRRLLSVLPERARDVIVSRYGLRDDTKRYTLESIGKRYGITRERVRQIENYAIHSIKKSSIFTKESEVFDELKKLLEALGGVIAEDDLLNHISKERLIQNYVHFLLVLGDVFEKAKEDDHFKHHWYVDKKLSEKVHNALRNLYNNIKNDELLSELDIVARFLNHIDDIEDHYKKEDVIRRWLSISKTIGKNPLGEWGLVSSPNVKAKGMRDYAFLVLRKHGSPIHFKEVAKTIEKLFGKKANVATTHNELIKDKRFVLVGRGLYALSEWGYMPGVVKDVIKNVLKKYGPLTKDEIVEKVLKERYVKENTILVNLHNTKLFKKDKDGRYTNVED
jgi:hypothetical protein